MGLRAGLMLGVSLMLFGIFVMAFASSAPGGGLMIVLGLLFFLPGAFIAGSTLLAWLSARLYGSLDNSAKRKVKWGVLVFLPVAWLAWSAVESYLYLRPSAVADREMVEAQRAKTEAQRALVEEDARQKLEAANEYLVGAWQDATQSGHVIMCSPGSWPTPATQNSSKGPRPKASVASLTPRRCGNFIPEQALSSCKWYDLARRTKSSMELLTGLSRSLSRFRPMAAWSDQDPAWNTPKSCRCTRATRLRWSPSRTPKWTSSSGFKFAIGTERRVTRRVVGSVPKKQR